MNRLSSYSDLVSKPPSCLLKPLDVTQRLLMGAGPSNPSPRVLKAGSLPILGIRHRDLHEIMREVKEGVQYMFQTQNEWTFCVTGSGNAAMEMAVVNLLEEGDVALICENGVWGRRMAEMVERNGSLVKMVSRPMGEVFTLGDVEKGLQEHQPKIVYLTLGESSGGTAQPMEGFGELCHRYGCLLVVDGVAIIGGAPVLMDNWEIDVMFAASQKGLSVPPSISPISFSQRARDVITCRKTRVRSLYFDADLNASQWNCNPSPIIYHITVCISGVYEMRESLAEFAEKGLYQCWKEHRECAEMLYKGVEDLGLELYVKDKTIRNPCLTTVKIPTGVEWRKIMNYVDAVHGVEISPGLGSLAGKVWRIGIMGHNADPKNVDRTLDALKDALNKYCAKPPIES